MKTLIVDRIESDFAVCEIEEGSFTDIPLKALPNGVKEGDVIKISVEAEETEKRKRFLTSPEEAGSKSSNYRQFRIIRFWKAGETKLCRLAMVNENG